MVWAGYTHIVSLGAGGALLRDLGQLVGYFCDLHMPLILSTEPPRELHLVYRSGLAPEQNADYPVIVGGPTETVSPVERTLRKIISNMRAVRTSKTPPQCALTKLLAKGKPSPTSQRYIRKQLRRCGHDRDASPLVKFILRAHYLQAYRHNQTTVEPARRIEIYKKPVVEFADAVVSKASKVANKIVSEAIAAQLVADVHLLMTAKRTWGNTWGELNAYTNGALADGACIFTPPASSPAVARTAVRPPVRFTGMPATAAEQTSFQHEIEAEVDRNRVTTLPLDPSSVTLQREALEARLGLCDIHAVCCDLCGILHVKSDEAVRKGRKDRIGVTYCLETGVTTCNNCRTSVYCRTISLLGVVVRAQVPSVAAVCTSCGTTSVNIFIRGVHPMCKRCYDNSGAAIADAIKCACGRPWSRQSGAQLCRQGGEVRYIGPCRDHADALPMVENGSVLRTFEEHAMIVNAHV